MKFLISLIFLVLLKLVFVNSQILSYLVLKSLTNSVSETIKSTSQNSQAQEQPETNGSGEPSLQTINNRQQRPYVSPTNTVGGNPLSVAIGAQPVNSNGCERLFTYRTDNSGLYHGLVTIPNPDRYRNVVKTVVTIASRLGSDYGELSLYKTNDESFTDVSNGLPLYMKMRFPFQNPLPKIHQIFLNDRLICSTPKGEKFYDFFISEACELQLIS